MVFLSNFKIGSNSITRVISTNKTILFDYPAPLCGKNYKFPTFSHKYVPLKFLIRKFFDIDSIFISSSESFGVFFLKNVKIYMTKPVFEQLILRYEQYLYMKVSYDDMDNSEIKKVYFESDNQNTEAYKNDVYSFDDYEIVSFENIDIDSFKKSVQSIRYNQLIVMENIVVQATPSGTSIGWCNYKLKFENKKSLLLLTSYSDKRRFSIQASKIDADYLKINRNKIISENQIIELTNYIRKYVNSPFENPIIIPTDFQTLFIEIIFHFLSLIENSELPVIIITPIFKKLDFILNIQSEWLNRDFFTISEPFPLRKYKNLHVYNTFSEYNFHPEKKSIIFCANETWQLVKDRMSVKNHEVLHIETYVSTFRNWLLDSKDIYFQSDGGINQNIKFDSNNRDQVLFSSTLENVKRIKTNKDSYLPGIEYDMEKEEEPKSNEIHFAIKVENTDEEILRNYNGTLIDNNDVYISIEKSTDTILTDSRIPMLENKVLLSGTLLNSDSENSGKMCKILYDKPSFIAEIIQNEEPIAYGDWFYFLNSKIKLRSNKNKQIEYSFLHI